MTLSSVFLSHGAPDLAIVPSAAHEFLKHLGGRIERPKALIVVSAHNTTHVPTVASGPSPHTVYDFGGFDPALREMTYPARGDAVLAGQVMEALQAAGIEAVFDGEAGYDHGVWVPLSLIYPDADIPIVQLSVQPHQSGEWHVALGRALAPLLTDGVLLIGSGGITHNLRAALGARSDDAPKPPEWVTDFSTGSTPHCARPGGASLARPCTSRRWPSRTTRQPSISIRFWSLWGLVGWTRKWSGCTPARPTVS